VSVIPPQPNAPDVSICVAGASLFLVIDLLKQSPIASRQVDLTSSPGTHWLPGSVLRMVMPAL